MSERQDQPNRPDRAERRKFVRLDEQLPVTVRQLEPAATVDCATRNIGAGGVCVYLARPVAVGTHLQLEVTLPAPHGRVAFVGVARWCLADPSPLAPQPGGPLAQPVLVGVEFVQIDPAARDAILRRAASAPRSLSAAS